MSLSRSATTVIESAPHRTRPAVSAPSSQRRDSLSDSTRLRRGLRRRSVRLSTVAPASPTMPPVTASTATTGCRNRPMSTPLPTVPKPCLRPRCAEKFSSVVSWIAKMWRPPIRSPVARPVSVSIADIVTSELRRNRPNRTSPARLPPSLRRHVVCPPTSAARKSRPTRARRISPNSPRLSSIPDITALLIKIKTTADIESHYPDPNTQYLAFDQSSYPRCVIP